MPPSPKLITLVMKALSEIDETGPEKTQLQELLRKIEAAKVAVEVEKQDYARRNLAFLAHLRDAVDEQIAASVPYFRSKTDLTWNEVGQVLGMSRQAAWERYRNE